MPPTLGGILPLVNIITIDSDNHGQTLVQTVPMHYSVPMTNCCWNMKNNYPRHNGDCLATYGPQFRDATMAVTFTDGKTIIYKNVRVCINRFDNDGISADGTTLKFEASDVCFTLLGVRQYTYEIDGDL